MPQVPTAIELDDAAFQAALQRASEESVIEAQGVHLSSERLAQLIAAAPEDSLRPGQRRVRYADFRGATFSGRANFDGATFSEAAVFREATFCEAAHFREATFSGKADFARATFSRYAGFDGATFGGQALFDEATFSGDALFDEATFGGYAVFREATFSRAARFARARFSRSALFDEATFSGNTNFREATFSGDADFDEVTFGGDAYFRRARFEQARQLGPVLVVGELVLRDAKFEQPVRIELSAVRASLARAVFRAGADVFVRWAEVTLEDAEFTAPSLLAQLSAPGPPGFLGWEEPLQQGGWVCRLAAPPAGFEPLVVSVRRAKVTSLTLSGVDLRACRFADAHGLDGLRLERVRLAQPPNGWRRVGRWRRVRWTRRQTVAEEHHWRAEHAYGNGWYEARDVRAPDWLPDASRAPDAEQIAGVYRALRKGREDNKDEPGAADFYYGEMEMRRHIKGHGTSQRASPRAERLILTLYWTLSGYGLRASRALTALAIVIALFTPAFHLYGFRDRVRPYAPITALRPESRVGFLPTPQQVLDGWESFEAWTYSAGTATAIIGAPEAQLTQTGRGLRIILRILGPLLIALALLAIRGRIKR